MPVLGKDVLIDVKGMKSDSCFIRQQRIGVLPTGGSLQRNRTVCQGAETHKRPQQFEKDRSIKYIKRKQHKNK